MKAGIGSYAFRWAISHPGLKASNRMGIYEFIDEASDLGAQSVQLCDNLPVQQMNIQQLTSLKEYADLKGISLELGMKGCQPEHVVKMIRQSSVLGVRILRIVLGSISGVRGSIEQYKELLEEPVRQAASEGVILAIENHFELSPFDLVELVEGIGSLNLKICLDVLNSVKFGSGYRETCRMLAPFAVTVHIKDAKINRFEDILNDKNSYRIPVSTRKEILDNFNTGFYVSGCRLGEGVVDVLRVIQMISQYGINPDLFLENWMDSRASVEETVSEEKKMVQHDFNQLKKFTNE